MRRRHLLAASLALASPALAQEAFPSRPVTVIVPFTAGSATDAAGRIMAAGLQEQLGQPVTIDNRTGAGGSVGTGAAARARPDGYTLVVAVTSTVAVNRALYRNLGFDPWKDFAPIGVAGFAPNILMVPGESPFGTVRDLLARGRDTGKPALRYFSGGTGSSQHLAAVLLVERSGIRAEHIPYRGPPEGIAALLAGQIEFGFSTPAPILGLTREGKLRALAVGGPSPHPAMPEVPLLKDLGFPDFAETDPFFGLMGPKDMPVAVVARLRAAFTAAMAEPTLRQRLQQAGFRPAEPMDGPALDRFMERQVNLWAPLVQASGAKVE